MHLKLILNDKQTKVDKERIYEALQEVFKTIRMF
jgi:hypothetical protein